MSNNLFISYDLYSPGQNYTGIFELIKTFGPWAKVQKSLWYVNSNYAAEQAARILWGVMDANDSLIVVDATNNDAYWFNISLEVKEQIQRQWG
nr:CRISPR-associated protein Cas2 [uncultured Pseudomonas sp.]